MSEHLPREVVSSPLQVQLIIIGSEAGYQVPRESAIKRDVVQTYRGQLAISRQSYLDLGAKSCWRVE
jgi:hypothetical protein